MTYLVVRWNDAVEDEPCVTYSELDEHRMELRKIDVFPDGRWGFANGCEEIGGSGLGEVPMPAVGELNASSEYEAEVIATEEFERLWDLRWSAPIMTAFPLINGGGESN